MQQDLFSQELVPLRAVTNLAKLEAGRYKDKNDNHTLDRLINATQGVTRVTEAILSADPVLLRLAGITPSMALTLAERLRRAAMAVRRR